MIFAKFLNKINKIINKQKYDEIEKITHINSILRLNIEVRQQFLLSHIKNIDDSKMSYKNKYEELKKRTNRIATAINSDLETNKILLSN